MRWRRPTTPLLATLRQASSKAARTAALQDREASALLIKKWSRLGQHNTTSGKKITKDQQSLMLDTVDVLRKMKIGELAKLAEAMAACHGKGPSRLVNELYDEVKRTAAGRAADADVSSLVHLAQSFAEGERQGMRRAPEVFEAIGRSVVEQGLDALGPKGVSKLAHACASVGHFQPSIFEAAGATAVSRLSDFAPPDASLLLWSMAVADVAHEELFQSRAFSELMASTADAEAWQQVELSRLHQFLLWSTAERSLVSPESLPRSLPDACHAAFTSSLSQPSLLQHQVAEQLEALEYKVEHEFITQQGYSLDLVVQNSSGLRVGVEVDGPTHFLGDTEVPTGATRLKRRQLRALGWILLPVPYFQVKFGSLAEQRKHDRQYGAAYTALDLRDSLEGLMHPLQQAYRVLRLDPMETSDADVKAAYLRQVKENHPDRVRHRGEASETEAAELTREILDAYQLIRQSAEARQERQERQQQHSAVVEEDWVADLKREARLAQRKKMKLAEASLKAKKEKEEMARVRASKEAEERARQKERAKEKEKERTAVAARALKDALDTPTIQGLTAAIKEAKGRVDAALLERAQIENDRLQQERRERKALEKEKEARLLREKREALDAERAHEAKLDEMFWAAPKLSHWEHSILYLHHKRLFADFDVIWDERRLIRQPIAPERRGRTSTYFDTVHVDLPNRVARNSMDRWFIWLQDIHDASLMVTVGERKPGNRFKGPWGLRPAFGDYALGPAPTLRTPPWVTMVQWFSWLMLAAIAYDSFKGLLHDEMPERVSEPPSVRLLRDERCQRMYNALGLVPHSWTLDRLGDFYKAAAFAGPRPGFDFKLGDEGLGYYRDGKRLEGDPFKRLGKGERGLMLMLVACGFLPFSQWVRVNGIFLGPPVGFVIWYRSTPDNERTR